MEEINNDDERIKRTLLYYPTISIPDGSWIRKALLYWDEVASIVPRGVFSKEPLITLSEDMKLLKDNGVFRFINPEALILGNEMMKPASELEKEFKSIFSGSFFQNLISNNKTYKFVKIHNHKVSSFIFNYLSQKNLAKVNSGDNHEWYLFEENTALLYMALLAKYISFVDKNVTIPGSDYSEYEKLIFDPISNEKVYNCLNIKFINALPSPREDSKLGDILDFKNKRKDELLNFRVVMDDFYDLIKDSNDYSHLKYNLLKFQEKLKKNIIGLDKLMSDSKLEKVLSISKTIINIKSPSFWSTALGTIVSPFTPILLFFGSLSGLIEISHCLVKKRNVKRIKKQKNDFAYIYSAKEHKILYT